MRKSAAFLSGSGALLVVACTVRSSAPDATPATQQTPAIRETTVEQAPPIEQAAPTEQAPVKNAPPIASATPAATSPTTQASPSRVRKPPPQTERDCKACNGDWRVHGLSQTPSCNCRTTDGDKRCKDGA